jgi:hypothetical protein
LIYSIESYSFSGLFGTGVKDIPPKRIATTNLSSSSTVKRSSTNDQIASIINTQENTADGSISERFGFIRFLNYSDVHLNETSFFFFNSSKDF